MSLGVAADLVEGGAIELAAEAELVAMGEMAAMREIEAEDGVAGLQDRGVGRGVGLGAGVGLHVDVLAAEDLFGAIAGQVLDNVGVLAAAVVAAAGIALGVFIGEDGAGCFENCFGDEVFAGNHLQALVLAEGFVVKGGGDFGVGLGEGERHAVSHKRILRHFGMRGLWISGWAQGGTGIAIRRSGVAASETPESGIVANKWCENMRKSRMGCDCSAATVLLLADGQRCWLSERA